MRTIWGLFDVKLFSLNHKGKHMRAICLKRWQWSVEVGKKENNAFSQGRKRAYDCKFPTMWLFHFIIYLYVG